MEDCVSWQLGLFVFLLSFVASIVQSTTAFGMAIVFMTGWRLLLPYLGFVDLSQDILTAALIMANSTTFLFLPLAIRVIRHCDMAYALLLAPLCLVFTPVGQYLVYILPKRYLGMSLGIVVLIAAAFKAFFEFKEMYLERRKNLAPMELKEENVEDDKDEDEDEKTKADLGDVEMGPVATDAIISESETDAYAGMIEEAKNNTAENKNDSSSSSKGVKENNLMDVKQHQWIRSTPRETALFVLRRISMLLRSKLGWFVVVCGASAGLLCGLFSIPGVPLMIFWAFSPRLEVKVLRATSMFTLSFGASLPRLVLLNIRPGIQFAKFWSLYAAGLGGGQLGIAIGLNLHRFINERLARGILLLLLLCSSTALILQNI